MSDDERGNFVLKVRLPLVRGAAECDLDITPVSFEWGVVSLDNRCNVAKFSLRLQLEFLL